MLHIFRPVKIWRHYELRHYHVTLCVRFFQNDDNQVNIGDPIEHIMINEYHIPYMIQVVYRTMKKILPRRMSTTACIFFKSFWPGNGSECRFAHKLQKFLGGDTEPLPCARTQGCCFQIPAVLAHTTFRQIVPARLL